MNHVPQIPRKTPLAEWHGGVAEHTVLALRVSEGDTVSRVRSPEKKDSTASKVVLWLMVWGLWLLLPLPVGDDLGAYHLPLRAFYQNSLLSGENWTWCPWIFGGYHLHGEGQIGGDHPLHQLLYSSLNFELAFRLECWWAYPAAFFGMWWWLRQLRLSETASQYAGFALSLSGYMMLRAVHLNAIQVIAHLPWLLGCLTWLEHRARHSTSWRSLLPPIACSALLTGSQLLLGYPQYVVFTLIAEGLWLTTLMLRSQEVRRILAASWLAAKSLGFLLGAAQVLPTLEYLSLSERMNWSSEAMFEGSWPMLNLTQLVAPYLLTTRVVGQNTHELTIFVGSTTIVLALLGLFYRPRKSLQSLKTLALFLGATGLLLALGDASPLAPLLQHLPVWNSFRFPCRATLLVCTNLIILAALGVQSILQEAHRRREIAGSRKLPLFNDAESKSLGLLLAASLATVLLGWFFCKEYLATSWYVLLSPALLGLACFIVGRVKAGHDTPGVLSFFLIVELLFYAGTSPELMKRGGFQPHFFAKADRLSKAQRAWDQNNTPMATPNWNIEPGVCFSGKPTNCTPFVTINGYAGVKPQRRLVYDDQHLGALRAAGIDTRWTLELDGGPEKNLGYEKITPLPIGGLPRGTLVSRAKVSESPAQELDQVDLRQIAIVDKDPRLLTPTSSNALRVSLMTDRPGQLAFDLETNRDALLVTTESFHPGWHARVDGADVPVLRVNGDFLGVRVPAAAQRVECYFSDNWHAVGRWISLGSLGLLGLVFCWPRTRQLALGFVR